MGRSVRKGFFVQERPEWFRWYICIGSGRFVQRRSVLSAGCLHEHAYLNIFWSRMLEQTFSHDAIHIMGAPVVFASVFKGSDSDWTELVSRVSELH